jgi:hypothetical protein
MDNPVTLSHSRVWDALAVVVLAASLIFRLGFLPDARFAGDEAYQYQTAKRTSEFKVFPVKGFSVTGDKAMTPGGTYHLLMAIPLLVSKQPESAIVFVVLLNIIALGGGYLLFRREYGSPGAFAALAMAAFNPFSVHFSDRHWNPNLLIPIGFLWVALMTHILRGNGRRSWIGLGALLVMAPQVHLSCTHLVFVTIASLVIARPRIDWKRAFLGIALGLLTYVPYGAVELWQGFPNTRALVSHMSHAAAPTGEAARALYYQALYGAGDMTYFVAKGFWFPMTEWGFLSGEGRERLAGFLGLPSVVGILHLSATLGAIILAVAAHVAQIGTFLGSWLRIGHKEVQRDPLALLVILNLPILVGSLLLARKLFFPHYTIVLFPLAMAPIAWGAGRLARARPSLPIAVSVLSLMFALHHGLLVAKDYRMEESRTSLHVMKEVASVIVSDGAGAGFRFECRVPRTRQGSYPVHVLARELHGQGLNESRTARIRYVLDLPESSLKSQALRVWDLGPVWLYRIGG